MTWLDDVTFYHLLVSRVYIGKSPICCSYVLCPLVHLMPPYTPCATPPEKRVGKWPSTSLNETSLNDNLFHHKNISQDCTWNKSHMWEISIFEILCEINPKIGNLTSKFPKSQSPKMVVDPLLCRACQDDPMTQESPKWCKFICKR
jgi:hypothetical protein